MSADSGIAPASGALAAHDAPEWCSRWAGIGAHVRPESLLTIDRNGCSRCAGIRTITYWAVTDLIEGEGSQRGYYNNVHGDKGHEWGTFEGKVTGDGTTVEGTWKITAGDGEFRGVTGSGNFKTMMKSETGIEATWDGNYELARTQTA